MIEVDTIDGGITVFRVFGEADVDEVLETIDHSYDEIGEGILWDATEGSFANLGTAQIKRIANRVAGLRKGGCTAYVASGDVDFGLLRMYEGLSEIAGAQHDRAVFRSREDAVTWLRSRLERGDPG